MVNARNTNSSDKHDQTETELYFLNYSQYCVSSSCCFNLLVHNKKPASQDKRFPSHIVASNIDGRTHTQTFLKFTSFRLVSCLYEVKPSHADLHGALNITQPGRDAPSSWPLIIITDWLVVSKKKKREVQQDKSKPDG